MGGYTPARPWNNGGAPAISAAWLTALEAVLSRPVGDTETGKYFFSFGSYTTGAWMNFYYCSISRSATPASVTIDEADAAHNGCNLPSTNHLTSNGVNLETQSTSTFNHEFVAGNVTLNY